MAMAYSCDGCGCSVEKPKRVGFVLTRDYCDACEKVAHAFQETEEAARMALVASFKEKRDAVISEYHAKGFKLPDVPDA